jgi:hypothetical protein
VFYRGDARHCLYPYFYTECFWSSGKLRVDIVVMPDELLRNYELQVLGRRGGLADLPTLRNYELIPRQKRRPC